MAFSKVTLNGTTLIDVTNVTATSDKVLSTYTSIGADGEHFTGTASGGTMQTKSVTYTPTTSQQTDTVTPDSGYGGLSEVDVTVNAVATGSATTPTTTITANPTISVSNSGLITAMASASRSITPTVSAGYVSSGTAGTVSVNGSNTSQLTTQAAQTIYPSTTDQTIASGRYLTGTQTIKAVTTTNLSASNILSGVTIKVGDSADDDRVASVTGNVTFVTYYTGSSTPTSSTGNNGDIYLKVVN